MIGLRKAFYVASNITVTNSVTPVSTGLTSAIAAGQTQHIRAWIPITVGATGGVRVLVTLPSGATLYTGSFRIYNTVAPSVSTAIQTASAAVTNALANAGTHWVAIEIYCLNGATAGNIDIQMAQNTSDANSLTILKGGFADVHLF